jgi:Na+-translocating ferredoxin:NAD+ oxidoreductase RnfC subunit
LLRKVKRVKILFSHHIGAPAKPIISLGKAVSCGEVIAAPADGLSVAIHASISGKVIEVNDKFAIIEAAEGEI